MNRVLLVEDDATLREGICLAVRSAEIDILQAVSLKQGRELLKQQSFNLVLLDINLPDESRPCVAALGAQAEKLRFLISALVKLSRLETGILTLRPVAAPLQPLLEAVETQYGPEAEKAGVELSFSETDAVAVHDAKWSAEALGNIVDNAIKYTPAGGRISVGVTPYQLFSRIDVADTGLGIAEEEQSKIFSRFYRSPAVSEREGVGIGLYLARQIFAEQGGYLKVKSAPGKGSVFSLFLPTEP